MLRIQWVLKLKLLSSRPAPPSPLPAEWVATLSHQSSRWEDAFHKQQTFATFSPPLIGLSSPPRASLTHFLFSDNVTKALILSPSSLSLSHSSLCSLSLHPSVHPRNRNELKLIFLMTWMTKTFDLWNSKSVLWSQTLPPSRVSSTCSFISSIQTKRRLPTKVTTHRRETHPHLQTNQRWVSVHAAHVGDDFKSYNLQCQTPCLHNPGRLISFSDKHLACSTKCVKLCPCHLPDKGQRDMRERKSRITENVMRGNREKSLFSLSF